MRIACVGTHLAASFRRMGHEVLDLHPPGGIVDIAALLDAHGFAPDLLVQQETLGARVILAELETLRCRKAYWAIDSHLNMHWHRHYARLFDVLFTPHLSLFRALPPQWRHPQAVHLAMSGHARPWQPHAGRGHDVSMVGVLDKHRPLRGWLAELLRGRFGVQARQGVPFAEMLALYGDTRIIPNESIGFEVNFRLTEGASCGACVLTPDVGPDQDALFDDGHEMVVYADGLDLLEKLRFLLRRPDVAERIGRAAWERVQAQHLPDHRAATMLEAVGSTPGNAATGMAGAEALWLTLFHRMRTDVLDLPPDAVPNALDDLPETPESMAARLRAVAEPPRGQTPLPVRETPALADVLDRLLATGAHAEDLDVNVAAAGAALVRGDLKAAKPFWYRLHQARQLRQPDKPQSVYHACLLWAELLRREGRDAQPGFTYDPERHCPEAAFEMLVLAQRHNGGDLEWMRGVERLTSRRKALTFYRLGILARLALEPGAPWRTQAEYGLTCLRAYRVEQGLHELAEAGRRATAEGQQRAFLRLLDGYAPGGHLRRGLDVAPAASPAMPSATPPDAEADISPDAIAAPPADGGDRT
ncbi:glycosyltransferase [Nitratidesulfovibrio sp. SRB-5]|uniref:glycosyltransferase family protein n=1 Tax=Nitratidesulfovibrio sp. SRB-5 TaxID=2872636 RepID=UPI00102511CC|nr:glycosyltransferase [Nitratidesulfovibrio sp. SRB-5]MBZ2173533.1 glycosyltransferase [Nitratidesulfovibrio sp. SRB-5]RXF74497.1 glycosyltransferase family 1 protein [Desulfovibrio sp. DS-1]